MSNTNQQSKRNRDAPPRSSASRKRDRAGGAPAAAPQPPVKKQKSAGQQRRQRNRRAQRNGRAMAELNAGGYRENLAAKGSARNRSGYGNKASMPVWESEYIAEIAPTAFPAFSLQQFAVNPGQAGCFPWLSRIAKNFEKYEFEFLDFVYKREVSEFATNGVTGKVIMSFDTDATDAPPTNKQQMEDTDPHVDCMPCENMRLSVPKDMLHRLTDAFFVRPGSQPAGTDLKTYDIGRLNVACQGTAANTAVGELHVEYALRLRIPVLTPDLPVETGTIQAAGGSIASGFPFGNAPVSTGSFAMTGAVATLTMTGLTTGQEYALTTLLTGTVITAVGVSADTGMAIVTQETNLINAVATAGAEVNTFTATAATATFTFAITATTVTSFVNVLAQLAPAPAF